MSKTKTGGPAFPCHPDSEINSPFDGMTLRDYFAAKAMRGLMGRAWGDTPAEELFAIWAAAAYAAADAMLKEREA